MSDNYKNVVRTSKGLQDALFDEIDDLHSGKTTPQAARTIASLAGGIIQTAKLEMDHARFIAEPRSGAIGDAATTKAIEFGSQSEDAGENGA